MNLLTVSDTINTCFCIFWCFDVILNISPAHKIQGALRVDQKEGILLCQATQSLLHVGILTPANALFNVFQIMQSFCMLTGLVHCKHLLTLSKAWPVILFYFFLLYPPPSMVVVNLVMSIKVHLSSLDYECSFAFWPVMCWLLCHLMLYRCIR